MRKTMTLLAAAVLLAGCGGTDVVDAPEVSIADAEWSGDEITVTADTNLPDGANLSWYVIEGEDWNDLDAAETQGTVAVDSGTATATIDVATFQADTASIDVSFLPTRGDQPKEVQDMELPDGWQDNNSDVTTVSRG